MWDFMWIQYRKPWNIAYLGVEKIGIFGSWSWFISGTKCKYPSTQGSTHRVRCGGKPSMNGADHFSVRKRYSGRFPATSRTVSFSATGHRWEFPFRHRGTPSHHPFLDGIFPFTKTIHPFWGTPMTQETPIYLAFIPDELSNDCRDVTEMMILMLTI